MYLVTLDHWVLPQAFRQGMVPGPFAVAGGQPWKLLCVDAQRCTPDQWFGENERASKALLQGPWYWTEETGGPSGRRA
ncbi:unnamed protein product [Lota lota]